jgi:Flp pilus assembly protein protease CpaA
MPFSFFMFLFLIIVLVSLYDLRSRKIPNWVSIPLMLLGIVASFPGNPILWIGSAFLFQAWRLGVIGGGDAKLWIGLLWSLFPFVGEAILFFLFLSLMITGGAQLLVRAPRARRLHPGIKAPGAWRTVVFMGCLAYFTAF